MSTSLSTKDRLSKELEEIKATLAVLSARVERIEIELRAESAAVSSEGWEVIEPAFECSSKFGISLASRIAEDGPPRASVELLAFARAKLSSALVPVEQRVRRSLAAGHWAWVACQTHTPYKPLGPLTGLQSQHWIVLRGPGITLPVRTTSKGDLSRLVDLKDRETVAEEFPSLAELEIFCFSASIPIPQCRRWTRTQSDLRR